MTWRDIGFWLYGLVGAFVGAFATTIGNIIVAPGTFNIDTPDGRGKLASSAVVNGLIAAFLFLKQRPLPPLLQEDKHSETAVETSLGTATTTTDTKTTIQPK